MDFAELRQLIPACREYAYFQTGTHSPKPTPVLDAVVRWLHYQNQGPALPWVMERMYQLLEEARAKIAKALGAEPEEIALLENTTEGIDCVANSLDFRPGDNVVITDEEHPANRVPWLALKERIGLDVRTVHASVDPEEFVPALDQVLSERTRLVAISHVSRETGKRLPVHEAAALCRDRGVALLVDGAQALGAVEVNVREIGCDFYAFGGHKYLLGPQGTGGLFVRRDVAERLRPTWVGAGSLDDRAGEGVHWSAGARRFEFGTRDLARFGGLVAALDIWEEIGWGRVHSRIGEYTAELKRALLELPGARLDTPLEWERSSAIVVLRLDGFASQRIVDSLLAEHKVVTVVNSAPEPGIRISTHVFSDEEDMQRLIDGLRHAMAAGVGRSERAVAGGPYRR